MTRVRSAVAWGVGLALLSSLALAQTAARRPSTIDSLRRFPGFYHLQNVVLRGEFVDGPRIQLRSDERLIDAVLEESVRTTGGPVEVRGQFIDVGRLEPGDPRLPPTSSNRDSGAWPKPGEELVLRVTSVGVAEPPPALSLRALALEPWRYEGQTVTLAGQFRGRNLFGDLPGSPALSKYDFVLRSGDGAVWVTGLRPKGRGFDLNVDARVDTGRWLEVTGVVRRERSLVTIEAASVVATTARTDTTPVEPTTPPPPPQPVEVVFSAPSPDETDVPATGTVRIQFSKGLDPASVASGFLAVYAGGEASPPIPFTATYDVATRSVQLRFEQRLAAFRTVRVEIRDTLRGFDGAPVAPWAITFSAGS